MGYELSFSDLEYFGEYGGYQAYSVLGYDGCIDCDMPMYPDIGQMRRMSFGFQFPFGGMFTNKYQLSVQVQPAPDFAEQLVVPDDPMFMSGYESLEMCDCVIFDKEHNICAEIVLLTGITYNTELPMEYYVGPCQAAVNAMCDFVSMRNGC